MGKSVFPHRVPTYHIEKSLRQLLCLPEHLHVMFMVIRNRHVPELMLTD